MRTEVSQVAIIIFVSVLVAARKPPPLPPQSPPLHVQKYYLRFWSVFGLVLAAPFYYVLNFTDETRMPMVRTMCGVCTQAPLCTLPTVGEPCYLATPAAA